MNKEKRNVARSDWGTEVCQNLPPAMEIGPRNGLAAGRRAPGRRSCVIGGILSRRTSNPRRGDLRSHEPGWPAIFPGLRFLAAEAKVPCQPALGGFLLF